MAMEDGGGGRLQVYDRATVTLSKEAKSILLLDCDVLLEKAHSLHLKLTESQLSGPFRSVLAFGRVLDDAFAFRKALGEEGAGPKKGDQGGRRVFGLRRCHLCSFTTKRSSHLEKHLKRHQGVLQLSKCGLCSFTCIRKSELTRHLCHQTHAGGFGAENSVVLEVSAEDMEETDEGADEGLGVKRNELASCWPQKTVRDKAPKKVHACNICNYTSPKAGNLKRHIVVRHSDDRTLLCSVCGQGFKRPDVLKKHLMGVHGIQVPSRKAGSGDGQICLECGKLCRDRFQAKQHQSSHSGHRNMLCQACSARFHTKTCLQRHLDLMHPDADGGCFT